MTDILERPVDNDPLEPVVSMPVVKQVIEAHLAAIHSEPEGRNRLICSALMIGSPVVRAQVQV